MNQVECLSNRRALRLTLTLLTLAAPPAAAQAPSPRDSVSVVTIPRNALYATDSITGRTVPDEANRLTVLVRDVARPDLALSAALISLQLLGPPADHPARSVSVDSRGLFLLEQPTPGLYEVTVRRVGYTTLRFRIRVGAACRQAVEAYLAPAAPQTERLMAPVPPTIQGRVTFTTCAPPA